MPTSPTHLGLLSDAHGNAPATRQAVAQLLRQGATCLIYLGDACDDRVLDELAGLQTAGAKPVPVHLVAGNCDRDIPALRRYAQYLELTFHTAPGVLKAAGQTLVFGHGHESDLWKKACAFGADFLLHGHTHAREDALRQHAKGRMRILCPGAVTGPRDGLPPACALLRLPEGTVEFMDLE